MEAIKRVCCFCQSWGSGGIESFLHNVLLRIDLAWIQVDIVAEKLEKSIFTEPLLEHGVNFFELSGDMHSVWENYQRFRQLVQERQYDVLHLNIFQGMSLYYAHIAKEAGIPIRIAHSHNTDLRLTKTYRLKLRIHRFFCRRYAKDASEFWACSKDAAKFMFPEKLLKKRGYSFIPNGIDRQRFQMDFLQREMFREQNGWADCFMVANIGRLCYQKNQAFLLDVLHELLPLRPESRLILIGEGEDKEMLQTKAASMGLLEKTIFYGTTDRIEELLWSVDVLAFPSLFEGFGIAALEAQAAGLPVLCSEFLPPEVHVSSLLRTVPLSGGVSQWAKALQNVPIRRSAPEGVSTDTWLVKDTAFDIAGVAQQIESAYLGADRQGGDTWYHT